MYTGMHAQQRPDKPAFIMASTGETVSYAELDARSNRLAHLLRAHGLKRLDHYSIFMENNARYLETCCAGERSGLYYTCVNSYLKADELAYILNNSESKALIASGVTRDVALEALKQCPNVKLCLIVDGAGDDGPFVDYVQAVSKLPATPIADESLGTAMLYSSGTTGRPKGILRPLPENPPSRPLPLWDFLANAWQCREDMIYLSPAPLYHSAPQGAVGLTIRNGGTAILMERFDPEQYLALVEKHRVTHSQLVPTMFSRMLKLPGEVRSRYDLSSLQFVVHAAAPCPVQVKEQMIAWWGPVIHEYYSATEGLGYTACNSEEWLAHRGTVGRVLLGDLHILDEEGKPSAKGVPGEIWFKTASPFEYYNDASRTAESRSADGAMSTVGDVGYVDDDGFLYLTDRSTFMIISGGVNIYPQECENLLITHPKVADAAVFGVPNEDLGEEVKAVIQPMPGVESGPELEKELIAFCAEHLSRQKVPRSIDFTDELPRLPTGKLYKKGLRDKYWAGHKSRIL
ncbi:AMP-binding protein [Quisquiliibacterium transsilvanicum]|uniref:Long-chain acyl-CoA synthetase n=1 Tax=Quisquiliibacterium transsilvanicum TaxID=1549638 RepID=A0A7W8HFE4_9BURK|nr:AMP-binding protein [Quisquiliibacterium transsilvanicum]MBB5270995.1 long-chain acyl-CoA synthetase [Quisquiliibacterium transsilvanicum]